MSKNFGICLISGAVTVSAAFIWIAATRELTTLENAFFQVFSLGLGTMGSYVFGQASAEDAAKEMIRPHARSAFRRLFSLYRSISRLAYVIEESRLVDGADGKTTHALDKLLCIVTEQIDTADDALEDWSDIVPDDVLELKSKMLSKLSGEKGNE